MEQMEPIPIPDDQLSKFLDDMMPTKLLWRCVYGVQWVVWNEEASTLFPFQEHIINTICSRELCLTGGTMIQFWAAEKKRGHHHLTTTLQPFSFNDLGLRKENIIKYRKICVSRVFQTSMDGILGRVFRNRLPEASQDLRNYSVKEYPQRDLALSCGFNSTMVLPVLEPSKESKQCCLGVLELFFSKNYSCFGGLQTIINGALKSAQLETIDMYQIREQIKDEYKDYVENEIKVASRAVCEEHQLTQAFVWVRCARTKGVDHDGFLHTSYNDYSVNYEGELLVFIPEMAFCAGGYQSDYENASSCIPLHVGQGLVGKAILYRKPCLCRDVSQLSITEYPFVHCARKSELAGCFAVCLRSILTNHEYVVEFFLPRNERYREDLHILLSSKILTTMKMHLKTFEVVTQDTKNGSFIVINTQLELETLQIYGGVMQSEAQNLVKKISCPREDLEQHFGKKLKDAANDLGVSKSTFKRWCREHNISRWPSYKRSKVCSSSSSPKQMKVASNVKPISQASEGNPLCSELATNVVQMSTTSTIMVRVPYGGNFIKFKLSYTSRMKDLIKNVIMRTKFVEGTFSITYFDEENYSILVTCDDDLKDCMDSLRLSGNTTIEMKIEPVAN